MEIALCERFHCLPWELDAGDLGRVLRGIALLDTYREAREHQQGGAMTARVARALLVEAQHGK